MVLINGEIAFGGGTEESIQFYLQNKNESGSDTLCYFKEELFSNLSFKIDKSCIYAKGKKTGAPIDRSDTIIFSTTITNSNTADIYLVYRFKNNQGEYVFVSSSSFSELKLNFEGEKEILMTIPSHFFNEGSIYVDVMISNGRRILFIEEDALNLLIVQEKRELGAWMGRTPGPLKPNFDWEFAN